MLIDTRPSRVKLMDRLRGFWREPTYREIPRINGKRRPPVLLSGRDYNSVPVHQYGKRTRLLNRKIEVAVRYNGKGQVIFQPTREGHLLIKHTR